MSALASQTILKDAVQIVPAGQKTRILIVADNPTASRAAATSLRGIGFDVLLCLFDGQTLSSTPVKAPDAVLCHLTDYIEMAPKIAKVIRTHFAPRQLPIIGALARIVPNISQEFDSTLFAPMHPTQIANRVGSMIRLGRIEGEITRRLKTLSNDFNETVELSDLSPNRRFRVLFIGKASPAFMIIVNAMQNKGVEVIAAFTSFSAFDYLHEGEFDAVIMNVLEQSEPALSISETMRKNSKLYHVPTLFLVEDDFQDEKLAYKQGARDLININAEPEEISSRILELANYHRIHEQMKREMFSIVPEAYRDTTNTVFSMQFFEKHLSRLVTDAQAADAAVTLLAVKLIPNGTYELSLEDYAHIQLQASKMIRDMLRMQDIVCRKADAFYLAFYETSEQNTVIIRDRLVKLLEDSPIQVLSDPSALITLYCQTTIKKVEETETADRALAILKNELEHASV